MEILLPPGLRIKSRKRDLLNYSDIGGGFERLK
jgi:hypothetical protein